MASLDHDALGPAEGRDSRATKHGLDTYTARPKPERRGVAVCLSGGGYRAALFHLGALRRLNELGLLTQVDTITSVSGGSIVAAHLAHRIGSWPQDGAVIEDWDQRIQRPLRTITKTNLRTWPILKRLLPWNWATRSTAVNALQKAYECHFRGSNLTSLPSHPRFVFCATDMVFGVNWVFDSGRHDGEKGRIGDYQAGYMSPAPPWPVSKAVAASSCFPPVFDPMPLHLAPKATSGGRYGKVDRDKLVGRISLTDGGVYDNLGLEPVWKDHEVVMVSDGGSVFEAEEGAGPFWRLSRYVSIANSQGGALRRRWLISSFISGALHGTYWGVGGSVESYEAETPGYSKEVADDYISEIRTDLDAFSDAEAAILVNHGYLLAEAAVRRHLPEMIAPGAVGLHIPHPNWMDEDRVKVALANSHKRKILGRW